MPPISQVYLAWCQGAASPQHPLKGPPMTMLQDQGSQQWDS